LAIVHRLLVAGWEDDVELWIACMVCRITVHAIAFTMQHMKTSYGLDGCVLHWFTSYLNGCTQFVRCLKLSSHPTDVLYGVPQ